MFGLMSKTLESFIKINVPTRVNMLMNWRLSYEHNLWSLERIILRILELQSENLFFVQSVRGALKSYLPDKFVFIDDVELEKLFVRSF